MLRRLLCPSITHSVVSCALRVMQVGAERYNLFVGCPQARTATLVLRGGSEQFIDEADRSLHDAIMIVRRSVHWGCGALFASTVAELGLCSSIYIICT